MSKPTHFDVAAFEANIRKVTEERHNAAMAAAASNDERAILNMKGELRDINISFVVWMAGKMNNNVDPEILGEVIIPLIGAMLMATCQNLTGADSDDMPQVIEDFGAAVTSCAQLLNATGAKIKAHATEGGNA